MKGSQDLLIIDFLILQNLSLPIGIETTNGEMKVLAPKDTTIPLKKDFMITTTIDNQKGIFIQIY